MTHYLAHVEFFAATFGDLPQGIFLRVVCMTHLQAKKAMSPPELGARIFLFI